MKHITSKLKYLPIFAFFAASIAFADTESNDENSNENDELLGVTYSLDSISVTNAIDELEAYISGSSSGGVSVSSTGSIGTLTGEFVENSNTVSGGALINASSSGVTIDGVAYGIGYIEADFIENTTPTAAAAAAAISNTGTIYSVDGDFILNSSTNGGSQGATTGAFINAGTVNSISGNFISNTSSNTYNKTSSGAANGILFNNAAGTINSLNSSFIGNILYAKAGTTHGALFNIGTINSVVGDFMGNKATGGGTVEAAAISNTGTIYEVSGNFINNYSTGTTGAVYNTGTIGFLASSSDMIFTGNLASTTYKAIHSTTTVFFNAYDGYEISVNDNITGAGTIYINYNLNDNLSDLDSVSSSYDYYSDYTSYSTVSFNNAVNNQTVIVCNGTLSLGGAEAGEVYTWTTYSDYTDGTLTAVSNSYTTAESIASLGGASVTVNSGAVLNIGTNASKSSVYVGSSGSITLQSGSEMIMDAYASLTIAGTFTYEDNVTFTVDLSDFVDGEFSYALFYFTSTTVEDNEASANALYSHLTTDGIFSVDGYTGDYYLSLGEDGTSIYINSGIAVPEPSTYAMIVGILALGFAYYRRRK